MLAMAPTDLRHGVADIAVRDLELQRAMCDPTFNPDAAAFFVFNFCVTQDEERGGAVCRMPDPVRRGFTLRFLDALDAARTDPHNIHDEKSRRMLHTWIACLYNLWAVQWVPGYVGLLISLNQDYVDDGGRNSKTFSMFGRMRFAYERLADHVRKQVDFSSMSAVCAENGAWVMGRAPTPEAGRGGGFVRAFVDECAHVEWMDSIHAALDPACRMGKVYMSTVNGPNNVFARVKRERYDGWRFFEGDWKGDPDKTVGKRETETPEERERYGSHVSPWFVSATSSLTSDDIAREYNRNYSKSRRGLVYREFDVQTHAPGLIEYDPSLELAVGVDYASTGIAAFAIGQPVGKREMRVIADYEISGQTLAQHAENLKHLLRAVGYEGRLEDVTLLDGPDGEMTEGSGSRKADYFREAGFLKVRRPLVKGPGSHDRGVDVVRVLLSQRRIRVSSRCRAMIDRFGEYRWPLERTTGQIKATKPVHDDSSHVMDALRYLVTGFFTAAEVKAYAPSTVGNDSYVARVRSAFQGARVAERAGSYARPLAPASGEMRW